MCDQLLDHHFVEAAEVDVPPLFSSEMILVQDASHKLDCLLPLDIKNKNIKYV